MQTASTSPVQTGDKGSERSNIDISGHVISYTCTNNNRVHSSLLRVTPCRLVNNYRHFEEAQYLLQTQPVHEEFLEKLESENTSSKH